MCDNCYTFQCDHSHISVQDLAKSTLSSGYYTRLNLARTCLHLMRRFDINTNTTMLSKDFNVDERDLQ